MFSGNMKMPPELCHLSPPSQEKAAKGIQLSEVHSKHFICSISLP